MMMSETAQELKDQALDALEDRHRDWVLNARDVAVKVALDFGSVSINDVRPRCPLPDGAHPSLYGAVFRTPALRAAGYVVAFHPESHGRAVRSYKLNNEEH
jgi:hypothetical protein